MYYNRRGRFRIIPEPKGRPTELCHQEKRWNWESCQGQSLTILCLSTTIVNQFKLRKYISSVIILAAWVAMLDLSWLNLPNSSSSELCLISFQLSTFKLVIICYYFQNNTFSLCSLLLIWFSQGIDGQRHTSHHETSRSVIITADQKVAPAQGTLGLWDLHSPSLRPTKRWLQLKVLLAYHETSIRDHYGDRKVAPA